MEKRKKGEVKIDGAYVQFLRTHGPVERNVARFPEAFTGEGQTEAVGPEGDEDEE